VCVHWCEREREEGERERKSYWKSDRVMERRERRRGIKRERKKDGIERGREEG
jgi:hypothetical protein